VSARIFLLGRDIDTDQLAPGRYMRGGIVELAAHCLETVRPDFVAKVRIGDIVVAGRNFGAGSSREQAVEVLRHLGVVALIAPSFGGIFYRNAINLGMPALVSDALAPVEDGDAAAVDLEGDVLRLVAKAVDIPLRPLPAKLKTLLDDGGLVPHLKKRFAAECDRQRVGASAQRIDGGADKGTPSRPSSNR
jgi:3-isopropylmalate/(R)-2-methylmalate dehydratase small subunit